MDSVYSITAIILAAGEGKRMYSKTPKVLHKVCGKAMVEHVVECARELGCDEPVVVVGHGADKVMENLNNVRFALQEKQLGTGHAVMQAEKHMNDGDVLLLYGDTPLLKADTLKKMYEIHKSGSFKATVLTAEVEDPTNYGRIIRDKEGNLEAIVEEKDADSEQKKVKEINSGIYYFDSKALKDALKELNNDNAQGEYYITDVISILKSKGFKTAAYKISDSQEIMGVNNRYQLWQANEIMKSRIMKEMMLSGVTIIDPNNTYIEKTVKVERDVTIYPGSILEGNTVISEDSVIGPNTRIKDCKIGPNVKVQNSVLIESEIGEGTTIGPFAYIRPGNKIGRFAKIGDFVEMKNSNFGDYSKASHLAYIGDGDVGSNVNLGCGVVFVNYDGLNKHRTVVEDNCFIGCNVNLIAPVKVNAYSYIAAGTTVTEEVPGGSLAVGRAKQRNVEGWVEKRGLLKK